MKGALTDLELYAMRLLATGHNRKEIVFILYPGEEISGAYKRVAGLMCQARRKLKANTTEQALVMLAEMGLVRSKDKK